MTLKELQQLPWRMQTHLAMEHEHASTYESKIGLKPIRKCVHTIKKDDYTFGRSYTHYLFDGKVYKSHAKVLEAINEHLSNKFWKRNDTDSETEVARLHALCNI